MDKQDRDLLIRMDERSANMSEKLDNHMKESKEFREKMMTKMDDHGNRLTALETKGKNGLGKFFAAIFGFLFKGG